ncbi:MAG TPA: glycosyltransferase [Rhodoferax sp.]|jgi:glycosyltransferase involved in cell wall biosynthesis|nr:glycosyltransferase [Rhodoferax sp.]HPW28568.1 glycosyltransferase [Rhodoferax sp.]
MKVLAITNLFGFPWDQTRGMYNQQQFDRLAQHVDLKVLVAVPWPEALRRPIAYWTARRDGRKMWAYVDYFIYWYPPRVGRRLHALCFLLSLILQRPASLLRYRRQTLIGSWAYPDAVAAAVIGKLTATPVLIKVHGSDVNDYLKEPAKRWQFLTAARHSHAVMCASAALRQQLIDAGLAPDHVVVNYNGVNTTRFKPRDRASARASLALPAEAKLLLFVGNLKLSKGCLDLLRAFVPMAAHDTRLMLLFIGDGEAHAQLEELTLRVGLRGRVRLLGKIAHAELPYWFSAADLLCLPSHNEGVPNVVLEAMACGLPVVATRVGGLPEVLPEFAGELLELGEPSALNVALDRALKRDWNTAKIVAHAQKFSWEANVACLHKLLQEAR